MKNKIIKSINVLILIVAFFLSLGSGQVFADGLYSITLSPPNQRMILAPGEEYHGTITVSNPNTSLESLNYIVSIGPFSQVANEESNDDYGRVDMTTVSDYNQIMEWISLEKDSGIVAPNTSDIIPFTIKVPSDAPAGGQYAMLIVSDNSDSSKNTKEGFYIQGAVSVGSIIYAEIAGETREEGEILENTIPGFIMNNFLKAESMVKNNGNVHTDASYTFQVWPLFTDEEICTNEEKPSASLIMPETERYHAELCELPTVGIFRARQIVKVFGETSIVEKTVIVCPLWLLFIIMFVIIAIIIYFIVRAKSRKNSRKRIETE